MYQTAHDVVEYLMQTVGGGSQDQEHRVLRAAVHHSYRDVVYARDWLWLVSEGSITTLANDNTYVLPEEVKNIDALVLPDRTTVTSYITPAEWLRLEQNNITLGEAVYYTVCKSTDAIDFDRWELKIAGRLPAGTVIRYTYRRAPKPLTLLGYETSCRTGFITAAGTTVTGISTNFPARSVGAILRIGTPSNYPEPLSGFYPYVSQHRIKTRGTDGKSLTLDTSAGTVTDQTRYVISDYLDVSPGMFTAILTGAELWAARLMGKDVNAALGLYQRDLKIAMENDTVTPLSGRRAPYDRIPDAANTAYAGSYTQMGPDQGA
jgi:hypothetical protein